MELGDYAREKKINHSKTQVRFRKLSLMGGLTMNPCYPTSTSNQKLTLVTNSIEMVNKML